MNIPVLIIIYQDPCSFLTLDDKIEKRVIADDQYAYKLNLFNFFLAYDKFQMEFANDYYALQQAQFKEFRHLIYLDGILLQKNSLAFRLPLLEMTYRVILSDNRCKKIVEGIQELHKIGYVQRDLKPDEIMMDFQPLRAYIIDFNRAQRVEALIGNVRDTSGYFPKREDGRDWEIA